MRAGEIREELLIGEAVETPFEGYVMEVAGGFVGLLIEELVLGPRHARHGQEGDEQERPFNSHSSRSSWASLGPRREVAPVPEVWSLIAQSLSNP